MMRILAEQEVGVDECRMVVVQVQQECMGNKLGFDNHSLRRDFGGVVGNKMRVVDIHSCRRAVGWRAVGFDTHSLGIVMRVVDGQMLMDCRRVVVGKQMLRVLDGQILMKIQMNINQMQSFGVVKKRFERQNIVPRQGFQFAKKRFERRSGSMDVLVLDYYYMPG